MKYEDIIVRVETNWLDENNEYYRNIIDYKIDCNDDVPGEFAGRFLKEINITKENNISNDTNKINVYLIDKEENIINSKNTKLESIIKYVKYQWGVNN